MTLIAPELLMVKSKGPVGAARETLAIAVDQPENDEEVRYSPATQNVDAALGSVDAPK